jgi:tetratricopeptide (TPR) repeat protein
MEEEMGEKDFSEIARLSERYNKDPKSKIFVQLADAYRKSNMIDEALEILNKGLAFNPNYPLAYLILGKCYFDKRMYEKAKESFGKTLNYDPQNIVALRMLAQTCEATKDEDGQMEAYRGILTIDPFDTQAKEKLTQLESLHKKGPIYTVTMAQEYETQGNLEKALSIYENLSFSDPTDLVLQQKVAKLKERTKRERQALQEEKIEGLQLDTYFQPEDLDKKDETTPIEPKSAPEPTSIQETVPEEKPEEFSPYDAGAKPEVLLTPTPIPDESPISQPVTAEPVQPSVTPETTDVEEPEGLDLLEPIEPVAAEQVVKPSQPAEAERIPEPIEKPGEKIGEQDLLQPIEAASEPEIVTPEPVTSEPIQETITPQKPDSAADLLQPIETTSEPTAEQEKSVVPKLVDITEPEPAAETPQPTITTPSDQGEITEDILKPIEEAEEIKKPEIIKEETTPFSPETATEPKSEDIETPGPETPEVSETSAESPSPGTDQKPQEEDFQSFKDWLGGLLK